MLAPSQVAAASSKLIPAGLWAIESASGTQTNSAFEPPRKPKTSSPTANPVTFEPTPSITPANSVPTIRRLGRRSPEKARLKNGLAERKPQSERVTVVA